MCIIDNHSFTQMEFKCNLMFNEILLEINTNIQILCV
jgi:hypothetical protein